VHLLTQDESNPLGDKIENQAARRIHSRHSFSRQARSLADDDLCLAGLHDQLFYCRPPLKKTEQFEITGLHLVIYGKKKFNPNYFSSTNSMIQKFIYCKIKT
jgi:hypothetical protein